VYTAPYAAWHTPVFLLNSRLGRFAATQKSFGAKPTPSWASLLPKLRDHYAEFLDHVSLVHLRLLASPTCVGLRYGHPNAPHATFLARRLHTTRAWVAPRSRGHVSAIFKVAYTLQRPSTKPLMLRSGVLAWFTTFGRDGNFNPLTIGYASGASP
jgi:hypothetical protein